MKLTATAADWAYIKYLTVLEHFEIADGLTVAAASDTTRAEPAFTLAILSVNIPQAIPIGANTFNGCEKLPTVSLPQATSIVEYAFSGCTALTTLELGATPPTVGISAFEYVPQTNPLVLLDASSTPLTDIALTTAQTAYKAANVHATDGKWYGWTVIAGAITLEINATYNETDNTIGAGKVYRGNTIYEAIPAINGIKKLKITAGTVREDDWKSLNYL